MTADEILAFARALPPTVTRVEWIEPGMHSLIIEQAVPTMVRAAPEIGDVEKAAKAREALKPSDVNSLGLVPPQFREE